MTIDDVLTSRTAGLNFVSGIASLRSRYASALHQIQVLETVISHFKDSLGGDDADPHARIDCVREHIDAQSRDVLRRKRQCRALQNALTELQRELAAQTSAREGEDERSRARIAELEAAVDEASQTIRKLKSQSQDLSRNLAAEREQRLESERVLGASRESELDSLTSEHDSFRARLLQELQTAQANYTAVSEELASSEAQLSKLRKLLQAQRSAAKQRDAEIDELKELLVQTERDLQERFAKEKAQLTDSFDGTITELRTQCDNHRSDIEKLAASLAETEARLNHSKAHSVAVQKEKHRLETDLRSVTDQLEREKKLADTTIRARTLAAESKSNARIEELKSRFENDKRSLFAFVADAFRTFYSPAEQIDERTFKYVIDRVREELHRLSASEYEIRSLVRATDGQTAQDAVAQFVLEKRY
jgi:chromosome segregation ATPase